MIQWINLRNTWPTALERVTTYLLLTRKKWNLLKALESLSLVNFCPCHKCELSTRQYFYEHEVISDLQNSQTYAAIDCFYNREFKIDTPSGIIENDHQAFLYLLHLRCGPDMAAAHKASTD